MPKLLQENKILKAILTSLSEGVIVADNHGKFIYFNPVAEKILGIGAQNVNPEEWASIYGAYYPDKITPYPSEQLPSARAMKGEEVINEIIFINNPERSEGVNVEVSASPLRDKNGVLNGGTAIFRDITEKKHSELLLKQSEKRLKEVFNEFPVPSYHWQHVKDDFVLIDYNKAAEVATLTSIKNFLGITLTKMYENFSYLQEIQSNFFQCLKEKKTINGEMKYQLQSTGEIKDFFVSYVFVDPDLIMIHTEDITKREQYQAELNKLSSAVEQTDDTVLITNTKGIIEYVNSAFEKTTGYTRSEVIGKTPGILKSGKHDKIFYKNLWSRILKGKTFRGEIINKKKNNELYWCEQTITPMKDNDGNITNYVSVIKDITELIQKQEQELELRLAQEHAKKSIKIDQMKSIFFANISHEFRTPLTLILGPLEKIISKSPDEEILKQTRLIKRNADRLSTLIDQLLDLSRLEAGKLKLAASYGNIVPFVTGITMSFESLVENKDISLRVKSEKRSIRLYFDKGNLEKALFNILSNAFKFTTEGGEITVTIDETGKNTVVIKVMDTGIGISEDELPRLFERFYQVNISHLGKPEGTGIGLALTKELIQLHHGTISVKSNQGVLSTGQAGWTEVTIELPMGREHFSDDEIVEEKTADNEVILNDLPAGKPGVKNFPQREIVSINEIGSSSCSEGHTPQIPPDDTRSKTVEDEKTIVLIVEDNSEVREYIKDSLSEKYKVVEAINGEQGVRKATKIIPDLIISDIMMPKMDGNELTRILKNDERTSHIPIILLTAKSEQESKLEGLDAGADNYLTKPFEMKELLIRMNNLINLRKKLQKRYSGGENVQKPKILSNIDEQFMCRVLEVIENHISEEEFSIQTLGKEVGMSRSQIHRKLRALTGKSPSLFTRSVRLQRAKKMIEERKSNISEIAYSVGFSSPAYFTRSFKTEFGYPPSDVLK